MIGARKLKVMGLYKPHRISIRGFIAINNVTHLDADTIELDISSDPELPPKDFIITKVTKLDELTADTFQVYPLGLYLLVFSFPPESRTEVLTL